LNDGHDTYRHVSATLSHDHHSLFVPELIATIWGTSLNIAEKSLQVTAQRVIRQHTSDFGRRSRTCQTYLPYHLLRPDVYSDFLF
jgi:hypothetical protein